MQGDGKRAIGDYDQALKLDPKNPRIYASRAALLNNMGDYTKAIADLNEAIKLRPREPIAYLNRGVAHFSMGQYDKAITDYDEVLKLDPQSVAAYSNRCMTRAIVGRDYPGATLKLRPNDPYAHDNLGLIYLKQGQWAKAIEAYTASLKVEPQRARALWPGRGEVQQRR